jgi:hypothetical protein
LFGSFLGTDGFVSGSFQLKENFSLRKYKDIANALKNESCVSEICDVLLKITSQDIPETGFFGRCPFTFLEGSSGSGKSQMGFTISAKLSNDRKVFYFLFEPAGSTSQDIYENFSNISELFKTCYDKDLKFFINDAVSPSCETIFAKKLYVYGFIYELISGKIENLRFGPKTGKEVVSLMETNEIKFKRPVFIVDECIAITDESLRTVRFVRNCFRSLGLGLVMCGTDSRAAKLPANIGASSRSKDAYPWCFVFGHFPTVKLSLFDLPESTPEWLKTILESSRPLFAQFAVDEIRKSPNFENFNFNSLLKAVFERLINVKKIFGKYYGQLGQLRLFNNSHYALKDFNEQSTALIHSHYAQLVGPKNFVLMNDSSVKGFGSDIWKPASVFPNCCSWVERVFLLFI